MREGMKIFLLRLALLVGVLLLGFILARAYREYSKKNKIEAEIEQLRQEAQKINKENSDFQEKIDYLQSIDYKKMEAKDKLNLQSPGENVVIVKPSQTKDILIQTEEQKPREIPAPDNRSNLGKWWDYFFKY